MDSEKIFQLLRKLNFLPKFRLEMESAEAVEARLKMLNFSEQDLEIFDSIITLESTKET